MNGIEEQPSAARRRRNLALAAIAGQAGCFTLVIVLLALFVGLWLDAQAGQRGLFTIGVLLLSIPISLFGMVRIALGAVKRITPPQPQLNRRDASSHTEEGEF